MNCPHCGMPESYRADGESVWHDCGSVLALDGDESLMSPSCREIARLRSELAQKTERVRVLEEADKEEDLMELVCQAHMAGQKNQADVDPSWSEAFTYWVHTAKPIAMTGVKEWV